MATTATENKVAEEKKEEVKFNPADYWCEIILEKTTREKAEDKNFLLMPLMYFMW